MRRLTTEEFISKAKQVHGDKYDYSKVEYINNTSKVYIVHKECGLSFLMRPINHVSQRQGCPCCYGTPRKTAEQFIQDAKQVHGDKYDYSKVEYINGHTKVCIICPEHGEFWQIPVQHLSKNGCPRCAGKNTDTVEFISKAKQIHGGKYDYSKAEYVNNKTKVIIICQKHGEFTQTPHDHLSGCGCPICKESQGEKMIRVYCEEHGLIPNEDYVQQYRSEWLGLQSLDFFFPKLNIGIEYDGRQHFEMVPAFGGEKEYKLIQERDSTKNLLCEQNGIKLIRISYKQTNDINKILDDIFST